MDSQALYVKCVMEALEHGFSYEEIVDECLACTQELAQEATLRHDDMGWQAPTTFSKNL